MKIVPTSFGRGHPPKGEGLRGPRRRRGAPRLGVPQQLVLVPRQRPRPALPDAERVQEEGEEAGRPAVPQGHQEGEDYRVTQKVSDWVWLT